MKIKKHFILTKMLTYGDWWDCQTFNFYIFSYLFLHQRLLWCYWSATNLGAKYLGVFSRSLKMKEKHISCAHLVLLRLFILRGKFIYFSILEWKNSQLCQKNNCELYYRTRAIITRSWSETALVYKPRILGLKNEEFSFLVHRWSVI